MDNVDEEPSEYDDAAPNHYTPYLLDNESLNQFSTSLSRKIAV